MRQNLFCNKNKSGQIYMYDVFIALIIAAVLFYVSVSHFMFQVHTFRVVTFSEANDFIGFLTSAKARDLTQSNKTLNKTLGLSIKERIISPDTTLAEVILVLYYVNKTRLDESLTALDDYVKDDFGRFNYWISLSNDTHKFFYNHSNIGMNDFNDAKERSKEYSSASILVTHANLTTIYGPTVLTATFCKD